MSEMVIKAPKGANKNKKIKGRGAGTGKAGTCGRGHKGQKSRSGGGVRPGFEGGQMPLYRRIAKRGFSNAKFKKIFTIVNLDVIENKYAENETVNSDTLLSKGIIDKVKLPVKILGDGEISKKLKVSVAKISKTALKKLKKAGCEIIDVTKVEKKVTKEKKEVADGESTS